MSRHPIYKEKKTKNRVLLVMLIGIIAMLFFMTMIKIQASIA
mgnify:CR=1 FL=1